MPSVISEVELQRISDKLRRMRNYKGTDIDPAGLQTARLLLGLEFLGFGEVKERPTIVEVLDKFVEMLDGANITEDSMGNLTELSAAIFPPLVIEVLTFWIDHSRSLTAMRHDLDNVFQTSFLEGDGWDCGAGPLLLAVLPFDVAVYLNNMWIRNNCKKLAVAYELQAAISIIPWRQSRLAVLTAFYCRAHKVQNLFTNLNAKKIVVDGHIVESSKPTLLLRKTIGKRSCPAPYEIPEEHTSDNFGITGVIDIEKNIISYLTPRALRSAEQTCRIWCSHITSTPSYCVQLHLGAFLRNRFVSFFEDSWGDENLNMTVLCRTRSFFISKYAAFTDNLKKRQAGDKNENAMSNN